MSTETTLDPMRNMHNNTCADERSPPNDRFMTFLSLLPLGTRSEFCLTSEKLFNLENLLEDYRVAKGGLS